MTSSAARRCHVLKQEVGDLCVAVPGRSTELDAEARADVAQDERLTRQPFLVGLTQHVRDAPAQGRHQSHVVFIC